MAHLIHSDGETYKGSPTNEDQAKGCHDVSMPVGASTSSLRGRREHTENYIVSDYEIDDHEIVVMIPESACARRSYGSLRRAHVDPVFYTIWFMIAGGLEYLS
jgi:hypothetical protein